MTSWLLTPVLVHLGCLSWRASYDVATGPNPSINQISNAMPDYESIKLLCAEITQLTLALSVSVSMAAAAVWIVAVFYKSARG